MQAGIVLRTPQSSRWRSDTDAADRCRDPETLSEAERPAFGGGAGNDADRTVFGYRRSAFRQRAKRPEEVALARKRTSGRDPFEIYPYFFAVARGLDRAGFRSATRMRGVAHVELDPLAEEGIVDAYEAVAGAIEDCAAQEIVQ